jgi:hypothetical protein
MQIGVLSCVGGYQGKVYGQHGWIVIFGALTETLGMRENMNRYRRACPQ